MRCTCARPTAAWSRWRPETRCGCRARWWRPQTHGELPLAELVGDRPGLTLVGGGRVEWSGPAGKVAVVVARWWAPPRVPCGAAASVGQAATDELRAAASARDVGLRPERIAALAAAPDDATQATAALGLLGRGPGLTPSGDDVLAGFLIGGRVCARRAIGVERAVAEHAGRATNALSTRLLRHAARGECVPELAAAVAALCRKPTSALPAAAGEAATAAGRLLAVGHTSGAALAHGLLAAVQAPPAANESGQLPTSVATAALGVAGRESS